MSHLSLHLVLSAEGASVLAVLRDFHLLDGLPQAGTVSGSILSGDSNLLGSLGHRNEILQLLKTASRLKIHILTAQLFEFNH